MIILDIEERKEKKVDAQPVNLIMLRSLTII